MPRDPKRRRQAEHARRRREVAEAVREAGGDPSEFVAEIRAAKGASQNKDDSIFGIPLDEDRPLSDRTPEEQEKFVRALKRAFRATEREVHHEGDVCDGGELAESVNNEKCALCRRDTTRRALDRDGRKWCTGPDEDQCIRIAQGRLGGATHAGRSSLSGKLRADGDCRKCGQPVKWVRTQRGKKMPVDVTPAPGGVAAFELVGQVNTLAFYVGESKRATFAGDLYCSHFQTCEENET